MLVRRRSPRWSVFVGTSARRAAVGHASAGLVYERTHCIVHTRVKPPATASGLYARMMDHHVRCHLVDDRKWHALSVPAMDELFRTNANARYARGVSACEGRLGERPGTTGPRVRALSRGLAAEGARDE